MTREAGVNILQHYRALSANYSFTVISLSFLSKVQRGILVNITEASRFI